MTLFNTLLLREWLQYKRAWIGLVLAPVLVLLALVPFSQVDGIDVPSPEPVALIAGLLTVGLVLALALGVSTYQLMGLARRDQQDRSIEFWSSLPGSHAASIGAPIVAHGLLVPVVATLLALVGGAVVGSAMAFKEFGLAALQQTQWAALFQGALWLGLRLAVGLVLAALWLSPIVLALMAASAWLKRWGAPLLVIGVSAFLKIYQNEPAAEMLRHALITQVAGVGASLVQSGTRLVIESDGDGHLNMQDFFDMLYRFPDYAREGLPQVLQAAVHPQFVGGLVIAGLCFWLLVLQRKRSL
ncbi:hypothetical protein ACQ86G_09370 [Roseateles chitinivorans]|uniref:hypothetical protein n=1 Tax=Roseateles chitinivorans TaxID=2917965 RepID=UPI003D67EA00